MRAIKFRAWAKEVKVMHPVWNVVSDEGGRYILMQFTGLSDKNNKEIYEGDILEIPVINEFGSVQQMRMAVMWCNHEGNWALTQTPEDSEAAHLVMGGKVRQYAVIGDMYNNPELLK